MIQITKVVSRNFIYDFIAHWQSFFGLNLTSYENMVGEATEQIEKELKEKGIGLKWYRMQITQLKNDALVVTVYGDKE